MSLSGGIRLGRYEIISRAGSGGMGEVYRARDTRLDRIVAIKVLPAHLSDDPDLRQRLEHEARALAALSHPSICPVHDIGHEEARTPEDVASGFSRKNEAIDFLVMEFLEGETLAARLAKGPLAIDLVLRFARDIADALAAAHERGIVHRDLKPGNVMLCRAGTEVPAYGNAAPRAGTDVPAYGDEAGRLERVGRNAAAGGGTPAVVDRTPVAVGRPPAVVGRNVSSGARDTVKLLDFGLAKRRVDGVEAGAGAAAITAAGLTSPGMIVGTPEYMAPEVIEGRDGDARADLFAFGAIVHEMATGRRAHPGVTQSTVIAAILYETPAALRTIRPDAPAEVEELVTACLAKDPAARWRSAHDARLLLDGLAARKDEAPPVRVRLAKLPWAFAGLAAALAIGMALWARPWTVAPADPVRRVSILPPPGTSFVVEETPQISPDGGRLLFAAMDLSGDTRLYVRSLESLEARAIPGSEGGTLPFWSPDGVGIGFFADGWLKVIEAAGAAPRTLARTSNPRGGSWREDGTIVFTPFPPQPPQMVSVRAGEATVTMIPADVPAGRTANADVVTRRWFPQWLPGGTEYLYLAGTAGGAGGALAIAEADGVGSSLPIRSGSGALYANTGHLLYAREGSLVAMPFDVRTRAVRGDAVTLVPRVSINPIGFQTPFSLSRSGVLVYLDPVPGARITRVDRSGAHLADLGPAGTYGTLCLSANDRTVVVEGAAERSTTLDIWIVGREETPATRLTFHEANDLSPVCSPDGSEIVFGSLREGAPDLYRLSAAAPATEVKLVDTPFAKIPTHWSDDGRWVIYGTITERGDWDLWALPMGGEPTPVRLVARAAHQTSARLSPDGRWLAYASNESGRYEIYVEPFQPGASSAPRWQISREGGNQPYWRGDGRELFYLSSDHAIVARDVRVAGATFDAGAPRPLFRPRLVALENHASMAQYAVSPKGDSFVINRMSDEAQARTVSVIFNWPGLLRK